MVSMLVYMLPVHSLKIMFIGMWRQEVTVAPYSGSSVNFYPWIVQKSKQKLLLCFVDVMLVVLVVLPLLLLCCCLTMFNTKKKGVAMQRKIDCVYAPLTVQLLCMYMYVCVCLLSFYVFIINGFLLVVLCFGWCLF